MLGWILPPAVWLPLVLTLNISLTLLSVYAAEDVLLRSEELWETMEEIHRHAVDVRISQLDRGKFDTSVNLGYSKGFNWIDVWGPTYVCPAMEHFGTIGDGGKWLCGVETMLQRDRCIIYSFGSKLDYSFEKEMLERTKCSLYVFDPTLTPSTMREREALLNGDGPKRITWYSVGLSDVDDDSSIALSCFGGFSLLDGVPGRKLLLEDSIATVWRPPDEQKTITTTESTSERSDTTSATPELSSRDAAIERIIEELKQEKTRITSTAGACGVQSHKPKGITALPDDDGKAGNIIHLENGPHGDTKTTCRMATLPSLMKSLGHSWVDVLKMDVEGSEYASLGYVAGLPGDAMRFTQLQLELHHQWTPDKSQPNVEQFSTLRELLSHGYRTTFLEPNIYWDAQQCHELAFIKMDECGNVVTPPLY